MVLLDTDHMSLLERGGEEYNGPKNLDNGNGENKLDYRP